MTTTTSMMTTTTTTTTMIVIAFSCSIRIQGVCCRSIERDRVRRDSRSAWNSTIVSLPPIEFRASKGTHSRRFHRARSLPPIMLISLSSAETRCVKITEKVVYADDSSGIFQIAKPSLFMHQRSRFSCLPSTLSRPEPASATKISSIN